MEAGAVWIYIEDDLGLWRLIDDWQLAAAVREGLVAAKKVSLLVSFIKPPPAVNDNFFEEAIIEDDIFYL